MPNYIFRVHTILIWPPIKCILQVQVQAFVVVHCYHQSVQKLMTQQILCRPSHNWIHLPKKKREKEMMMYLCLEDIVKLNHTFRHCLTQSVAFGLHQISLCSLGNCTIKKSEKVYEVTASYTCNQTCYTVQVHVPLESSRLQLGKQS